METRPSYDKVLQLQLCQALRDLQEAGKYRRAISLEENVWHYLITTVTLYAGKESYMQILKGCYPTQYPSFKHLKEIHLKIKTLFMN